MLEAHQKMLWSYCSAQWFFKTPSYAIHRLGHTKTEGRVRGRGTTVALRTVVCTKDNNTEALPVNKILSHLPSIPLYY